MTRIISIAGALLWLQYSSGFLLNANGTQSGGECRDSRDSCQFLNDTFQVCADVVKAREICKQYCGLCSIVDGSWSDWKSWSACDVTCGNGLKSRSRTCDNPPPANGGFECFGNSTETSVCSLETCPVNGGWSAWSDWGSCSTSCGAGLQRRDRICDNPWPSKDGNHCFGDSVDNRICQQQACAVAFQVHNIKNSNPGFDEKIIYQTIQENVGNAFNTTTSEFTAPFNGVYLFVVQVCFRQMSRVEFVLIKNEPNGVFQRHFNYDASNIETSCSSTQAFVRLVKGDRVYVACAYAISLSLVEDGYRYNSFGGSIITHM